MSDERATTEQLLSEIARAKAEQLDIARSWILLFTLAATFGLWWVFYNQLKLDFYLSWLLGFVAAFVLSRILSFCVGMHLGKKYARQLKNQLLGQMAQTLKNPNAPAVTREAEENRWR
jgi:hypothetical protein